MEGSSQATGSPSVVVDNELDLFKDLLLMLLFTCILLCQRPMLIIMFFLLRFSGRFLFEMVIFILL